MEFLAYLRAHAPQQDLKTLDAAWEILRQAYIVLNGRAAIALNVGDRVQFAGRRGRILRGTVTGFGRSNVKVTSDDQVGWTVPPAALEKLAEGEH